MKKLILTLLITVFSFAGTLRILNVPLNSEIKINNETYTNDSQKFETELKPGTYNITIKNENFLPIKIKDVKIEKNKPKIIILNEHTSSGVKYPVVKLKKYFKNIIIRVPEVKSSGDTVYRKNYCEYGVDCKVYISGGLFSSDKKYNEKYESNLYVFDNSLKNTDTYIKVSGDTFYSTSVTVPTTQNDKIYFKPVPSWNSFGVGIGIAFNNQKVILTSKSTGDAFEMKSGDFLGYALVIDEKFNTPINFFIAMKLRGYYLPATTDAIDKYELDDSTDDTNNKLSGFQYGGGIGFFLTSGGLYIEGGMLKNSLKYEAVKYNYNTYTQDKYEYEDTDMEYYAELGYGRFHITYTKSVTTFSLSTSF